MSTRVMIPGSRFAAAADNFARWRPYASIAGNSYSFAHNPLVHRMRLATISQSILEAMKSHKVIPDVVDDFVPSSLLSVDYAGGHHAALGNTLQYSETRGLPKFSITHINDHEAPTQSLLSPSQRFTIVMTDPDAPPTSDAHRSSHYANFVISGIRVTSTDAVTELDTGMPDSPETVAPANGQVLLEYQLPILDLPTRRHRYVFLLYREDGRTVPKTPPERHNWGFGSAVAGAREWANRYSLTLVGANFFYIHNELAMQPGQNK
ncbi:phosphatidylethanolamine-binding protein [Lipomyces chichibuensis]|uniref:phosphatidylethanolamine-binding protein n=1 Tax=Lipomyces chichibuensis TaxID=1546026 RepID=UPI003343A633